METLRSDVVVVGAGLAGCAVATLLARSGASVTLLEAHRDPRHHKRTCTHYLQPGAVPVLERLDLGPALARAGAVPNTADVWTRWGWIRPSDRVPHGLDVRRSTLDPLLRARALATPGVRGVLGARVRGLLRDGDRAVGVTADTPDGPREVRARLVVGADGRHSAVARLAGVPAEESPHGRSCWFAPYEGVVPRAGPRPQIWFLDPDVAYAFPNDGGTTVLGTAVLPEREEPFREDADSALRAALAALPDAPDLAAARLVGPPVGVRHYANTRREVTAPGLALVGDAAMTTDYLWAVGCGWALQSAEWLADAVGPALAPSAEGTVDRALDAYRRRHHRELDAHHRLIAQGSTGRRLTPLERLLFSGAARDPVLADRFDLFGSRLLQPREFLTPGLVWRAARADLAHAAAATRRRAARTRDREGAGTTT